MDFVKLCLDNGATNAQAVKTEALTFSPELRELCLMNSCGCSGKNHACPPLIGDVHELIAKVTSFPSAVVAQTIHSLEDSFDFEGMEEAAVKHRAMTRKVAEAVYAEYTRDEKALVLGAGTCGYCETCAAQDNEPCRFPDKMISSVEAHGMNVSLIRNATDMKYINGPNTVTYFSAIFYRG